MKLLDLFSGAGGCSVGYNRAGFEVTGVDIEHHPSYPFTQITADAMEVLKDITFLRQFDVIHASPPCQRYTLALRHDPKHQKTFPDYLPTVRTRLMAAGVPWVIENVPGAPMRDAVMLCGSTFPELQVRRHRLFESSHMLMSEKCRHIPGEKIYVVAGGCSTSHFKNKYGYYPPIAEVKEAMGIDWPMPRKDVTQSIPPAYTEYIGDQLAAHLRMAVAA